MLVVTKLREIVKVQGQKLQTFCSRTSSFQTVANYNSQGASQNDSFRHQPTCRLIGHVKKCEKMREKCLVKVGKGTFEELTAGHWQPWLKMSRLQTKCLSFPLPKVPNIYGTVAVHGITLHHNVKAYWLIRRR